MASVRERNGRFTGLYRDAGGSQRSAGTYDTKRQALSAAKKAEKGIMPVKDEPVYASKVRGKPTVASYSSQWFDGHPMAPHTRYVYEQMIRVHILPVLGMLALSAVTTADIRRMFRALEAKGTSHALLAKIKTVLSSMLQTAAEDGLIAVNPVRGVRFQAAPPARRRALTADEWKRVRKYLTGEWLLLCDLVVATGCRLEEALGIRPGDIHGGVWTIARTRAEIDGRFHYQERTKTGRTRQVPVDGDLAARLVANGPFSEFLLDTFRLCHWYPACKAAGLDWRPAPRDMRRSHATWAREAGIPVDVIGRQLGHTRQETTTIYLDYRGEVSTEVSDAVRRALAS